MKRQWLLMVLTMLASGHVLAAKDGLVGKNNQEVEFHVFAGRMTFVGIEPSAIPGTTLLIQQMFGSTLMKVCIFMVKGKVENQADIDALKPESVLQMSCTPEVVNTKDLRSQ